MKGAEKDKETGKKIKKEEAISKFKQSHLNIMESHILFFNPFKEVKLINDGEIANEIDKEMFMDNIKVFWGKISDEINKMYLAFSSELADSLKDLNLLKNNKITEEVVEKFSKIQTNIGNEKNEFEKKYSILDNLNSDLLNKHHNRIKAMVRRQGAYDNCDIYSIISKLGGAEFSNEISPSKNRLIGQINELFSDSDDIGTICKNTIIEYVNNVFLGLFIKNQEYYYEHLKKLVYNEVSWKEQRNYSGDGYKKRTIDKTMSIIEEYGFQCSELFESFFDEINAFLILE